MFKHRRAPWRAPLTLHEPRRLALDEVSVVPLQA